MLLLGSTKQLQTHTHTHTHTHTEEKRKNPPPQKEKKNRKKERKKRKKETAQGMNKSFNTTVLFSCFPALGLWTLDHWKVIFYSMG